MIIDSIKNVGFYSGMSEHLKDVARFLNENALEDIQAGKYVLNDSVFYYCFEGWASKAVIVELSFLSEHL